MEETQKEEKKQQGISLPNIPIGGRGFPGLGTGSKLAGRAAMAAAQAGSRLVAFLFFTPEGWVILGIGIVVILTFIIVLSIGGGGSSQTPPA